MHAHARACVNALRIVSIDKILRFTNTLIIILTLPPLQTHTTVAAYIVAGDNMWRWATICAMNVGDKICRNRHACSNTRAGTYPADCSVRSAAMPQLQRSENAAFFFLFSENLFIRVTLD